MVEQTIINCNGSEAEHHRGFIFNNFEDANSVLDGLTIKNGYQHEGGGAIACLQASPTIKNCVITENTSFGKGAGMYIDGAGMIIDQPNPIIINCTFSYNNVLACLLSTGGGAGINMADSSPEIIDCKFIANAGGCGGGGIAIWWSGRPKIIDCTFKENFEALGTNVGGNPSLIGCSFINNNYGAIYGGNLLVTNCVFADNSHTFDGGAVRLWSGTTSSTFNNCLFYNNSADERGGAVFL
ncbi:MAG: right-handed parallel beta-helix repeat-containing protein, partial [Planctomycetota bacterium]